MMSTINFFLKSTWRPSQRTDPTEDVLRKLIERVTSKIEKKIEDLFGRLTNVESNMTTVQVGEDDIAKIQQKHLAILGEESKLRSKESEKFLNQLSQVKLDLFSRMEAERNESVRIWEDHIREVIQKIEDTRGRVAGRVAEIEAVKAVEEASARREEQQRAQSRRHILDE